MTDQIPPQTIVEMASSIGEIMGEVRGIRKDIAEHRDDHNRAEDNSKWAIRTAVAALGVAFAAAGLVLSGGCG